MKNKMEKAEKILSRNNLLCKKPDTVRLGHSLGFSINEGDIFNSNDMDNHINETDYVRGIIACSYDDSRIILLDGSQDYIYKRFTIAYLLSGFILANYPKNYGSFLVANEYDKEVLKFCRDLLLPNKFIIKQLEEPNIKNLCKEYEVPDFVMAQKIKSLRKEGRK